MVCEEEDEDWGVGYGSRGSLDHTVKNPLCSPCFISHSLPRSATEAPVSFVPLACSVLIALKTAFHFVRRLPLQNAPLKLQV